MACGYTEERKMGGKVLESEERLIAYNWQKGKTCETVKGKREEGKH